MSVSSGREVKNPPASAGDTRRGEDPLEQKMATHSRILPEIPWTEEPDGLCPWGLTEAGMTEHAPLRVSSGRFRWLSGQRTCLQCRRCRGLGFPPQVTEILEKGVVTHSSILAWRIPRTAEPGGLQSMASHRVRHD